MVKDLFSGFSKFGYRCGDSQRTFIAESAIGDTDGNTVSHFYALAMFRTGHCLPAPFFTEPHWFWLWAWVFPAFWRARRESVAYLRQEVVDKSHYSKLEEGKLDPELYGEIYVSE